MSESGIALTGQAAPPSGATSTDHHKAAPRGRYLLGLSLAAIGVVYGDIGTSPLYAVRECFKGEHGVPCPPATSSACSRSSSGPSSSS